MNTVNILNHATASAATAKPGGIAYGQHGLRVLSVADFFAALDNIETAIGMVTGYERRGESAEPETIPEMIAVSCQGEINSLRHTVKTNRDGVIAAHALGLCSNLLGLIDECADGEIVRKFITAMNDTVPAAAARGAARGLERVIRKREKKRQDKRKSSVDAKRKESAIAKMKNLVPEIGQVKAAEKVLAWMNRGRVEPLGVKAGTVRRWYNARLDEERKARKETAARRLGRPPT